MNNTEKTMNKKESSEVVFASAPTKSKSKSKSKKGTKYKTTSHKTYGAHKAKKSSSAKVAIISVCITVLVLAAGGVGAYFLFFNGNNTAPTVATDDNNNTQQGSAKVDEINTDSIVFGDKVTVEGVNLSGMTLSKANAALKEAELATRDKININITGGDKEVTITEDDLDYTFDTVSVLLDAYHYSRGELDNPSSSHTKDEKTGITNFKITSTLSETAPEDIVSKAAKKLNVKAIDAHVSKFDPTAKKKFTYADGTNGKSVDEADLSSQVAAILGKSDKSGMIMASMQDVPFKVDLETIKTKTELISSYETTTTNVWASNHNMEVVMNQINGAIIRPNEIFSFNKLSGDSTKPDLGYVESTAIVNGKYVPQYGGGICQAATTIYNAGVMANMEIIERAPHQYCSTYVPLGLDATINYGDIDLKMRNTSDFPMYFATYMYDNNGDGWPELMIEIYGEKPTDYDEIVFVGWVTGRTSTTYNTASARVYFKDGKEIKRERIWRSTYDLHGESDYQLTYNGDLENGPEVSPTNQPPKHYGE